MARGEGRSLIGCVSQGGSGGVMVCRRMYQKRRDMLARGSG